MPRKGKLKTEREGRGWGGGIWEREVSVFFSSVLLTLESFVLIHKLDKFVWSPRILTKCNADSPSQPAHHLTSMQHIYQHNCQKKRSNGTDVLVAAECLTDFRYKQNLQATFWTSQPTSDTQEQQTFLSSHFKFYSLYFSVLESAWNRHTCNSQANAT